MIALVGGLGLVASYWMPWFSLSDPRGSLSLSGSFLWSFLSSTTDLGRVVPGLSSSPGEVQLLRFAVVAAPLSGFFVTLLAASGIQLRFRWPGTALLLIFGGLPLLCLAVGTQRLPPGARPEIGLWLIGAGGFAALAGALLEWLEAR